MLGNYELLFGDYKEEDLMEDVYSSLYDKEPKEVLKELDTGKKYLKKLIKVLKIKLAKKYRKSELKDYAKIYHKGIVRRFREVDCEGYSEENVQFMLTRIYSHYGEYIFYTPDLVKVMEVAKDDVKVKTVEDFILMTLINKVMNDEDTKRQIRESDSRLIKENTRFKEGIMKWDLRTFGEFDSLVSFEIYTRYADLVYGEESSGMLSIIHRTGGYARYLGMMTDDVKTQGKEEAIDELRKMYPVKFKKEDDGIIELENHSFSWRDDILIIPKEHDGEIQRLSSNDKDTILGWLDYQNLHKEFH